MYNKERKFIVKKTLHNGVYPPAPKNEVLIEVGSQK